MLLGVCIHAGVSFKEAYASSLVMVKVLAFNREEWTTFEGPGDVEL